MLRGNRVGATRKGRSRTARGWYHRAEKWGRKVIYPFVRPLLFALDPETAHGMTLATLDAAARLGLVQALAARAPPSPVTAMGLQFPNRIGLAAGLDKNAAHI